MSKKWAVGVGIVACAWIIAFALSTKTLWSKGADLIAKDASVEMSEERSAPVPAPTSTVSSGCGQGAICGGGAARGGGSCCGGGGTTNAQGRAARIAQVERILYNIYAKKLEDPKITIKAKDFGCHMEALVLKDGKTLKRLSVGRGGVTEIG